MLNPRPVHSYLELFLSQYTTIKIWKMKILFLTSNFWKPEGWIYHFYLLGSYLYLKLLVYYSPERRPTFKVWTFLSEFFKSYRVIKFINFVSIREFLIQLDLKKLRIRLRPEEKTELRLRFLIIHVTKCKNCQGSL